MIRNLDNSDEQDKISLDKEEPDKDEQNEQDEELRIVTRVRTAVEFTALDWGTAGTGGPARNAVRLPVPAHETQSSAV